MRRWRRRARRAPRAARSRATPSSARLPSGSSVHCDVADRVTRAAPRQPVPDDTKRQVVRERRSVPGSARECPTRRRAAHRRRSTSRDGDALLASARSSAARASGSPTDAGNSSVASVCCASAQSVRCSAIVSASRQTTRSRQRANRPVDVRRRADVDEFVPSDVTRRAPSDAAVRRSVAVARRAPPVVPSRARSDRGRRPADTPSSWRTDFLRAAALQPAGPSGRPGLIPRADDDAGGRGDRCRQLLLEDRLDLREELLEIRVVVRVLDRERFLVGLQNRIDEQIATPRSASNAASRALPIGLTGAGVSVSRDSNRSIRSRSKRA